MSGAPVASVEICGYAAKWDTASAWLSDPKVSSTAFSERVARGAFRRVIAARRNVFLRCNHYLEGIYAEVGAGTLTLCEDIAGLWFEARIDDASADGRWLLELFDRGQVRGLSPAWHNEDVRDTWTDGRYRTLFEIPQLVEISLITEGKNPAWRGTWAAIAGPDAWHRQRHEMRAAMDRHSRDIGRQKAETVSMELHKEYANGNRMQSLPQSVRAALARVNTWNTKPETCGTCRTALATCLTGDKAYCDTCKPSTRAHRAARPAAQIAPAAARDLARMRARLAAAERGESLGTTRPRASRPAYSAAPKANITWPKRVATRY